MATSAPQDSSPRARAVRQLRLWLSQGQPPAGERLPAEQHLADRLQVSRGTVRAAIAILEQEGLLRGRLVLNPGARPPCGPSVLMANTVIMVSAHADGAERFRGSGYSAAVDVGAMDALHASGVGLLVLPPNGLTDAGLEEIMQQRLRGVLVPMRACESAGTLERALRLREAGVPVVVNSGEAGYQTFDRVEHDHHQGSRMLCSWLIARGRRRTTFFTTKDLRMAWVRSRIAGADEAMCAAGLTPCAPIQVVGRLDIDDLSPDQRFAARARFYAGFIADRLRGDDRPDAFLVASDGEVYALAAAVRLLGLQPQRDIDLVGYDGYWTSCAEDRSFEPTEPLATVDKNNHLIGIELVRLLDARLAGKLPEAPQRVLLPPRFIEITAP